MWRRDRPNVFVHRSDVAESDLAGQMASKPELIFRVSSRGGKDVATSLRTLIVSGADACQ